MSRHAEQTFRPQLEVFEDRAVPAAPGLYPYLRYLPYMAAMPPGHPHPAVLKLPSRPVFFGIAPSLGAGSLSGLVVTTNFSSFSASGLAGPAPQSATSPGLSLNLSNLGVGGSVFGSPPAIPTTPTAAPGTAGAVPTLISPFGGQVSSFSMVPAFSTTALTGPAQTFTLTIPSTAGLNRPGMITPASLRSDPGISLPI
jgi:hypothetical protein